MSKDEGQVLSLLTGSTEEPDYFKLAGSLKESLLDVARHTKVATPKDALKRLMIERVAAVGGGMNWDERIARLLGECYAYFLAYAKLTEGFFSDEESQMMLKRLDGNLRDLKAENHAEHQQTRLVCEDAILEKRKRGREAKEAETRVQMALDRMEEKIAGSKGQYGGMSPEDAADEVWGEMSSDGQQLRISAKRLSERYRNERMLKPGTGKPSRK